MATISYRQGAHSLNSVISFLKKILLNFRFQHLFIQVIWFSSTVKSESVSRSAMSNSLHLVECSLPGSSVHGDSPGKNTRVGYYALLQGIFPTQGSNPGLWVDSLLSEPPVKPENTGVGSLSLLQGNIPTQESTRGLLHCRQILYQVSHQGSPRL